MAHVLDHGPNARLAPALIERIDPRARIVAAVVFAIVTVSSATLTALLLALATAAGALLVSGAPLLGTLKRMLVMDGFIIILLLLLPFTVPGDPAFTLFGLSASFEGVERAVHIALKANAVVLLLLVLVGTLEPVTFGHALLRLKVPPTLIHLLLFTVRYIDVLHDEYLRARIAMKARGFRPANSRHTYVCIGYLVGMILIRAVERSERILAAMKCRGFCGHIYLLDERVYTRADLYFAALALLGLALIAAANVFGVNV